MHSNASSNDISAHEIPAGLPPRVFTLLQSQLTACTYGKNEEYYQGTVCMAGSTEDSPCSRQAPSAKIASRALQIPAVNSTTGVQHGVAAPPLLYSRRATGGIICNFHVSRRLSPHFNQTFIQINLPGIGRQDCACQRGGFSNQPVYDSDCHEPRPPHDSPGSPNRHRPNFRPK